jgi:hypothetical protein
MGHFALWITRIRGRNRGILSSMSFENLTPTWNDRPLTDPGLAADVVDLMVTIGDRQKGSITAIVCGPDDRFRTAMAVELLPDFAGLAATELFRTALRPVLEALGTSPDAGLVVALGRPEHDVLAAMDHTWARAATEVCEAAGVRLLGFYVATKLGIHQPSSGRVLI